VRTKKELKAYFDEIIDGIVYPELDRCIKVDAKYVAALALLSYTEFIGVLISGHLGSREPSKDNFKAALKYFPKEYQDIDSTIKVDYSDGQGKPKTYAGIYSVFRCGLAHEGLIKGDSLVLNDPNGQVNSNRIGVVIHQPGKILGFHVKEYFRDFKLAVEKIREQLFTNSDSALLGECYKSITRIYSRRVL
jgi:hypothetical protein